MNDEVQPRALDQKKRGGRVRTNLLGHTLLLVEDDFVQARDIQQALQHAGAIVLGPFGDLPSALFSTSTGNPSCAILSICLADGLGFRVARALIERKVPFIFLTALDSSAIPEEFAAIPALQKPVSLRAMLSLAAQISNEC